MTCQGNPRRRHQRNLHPVPEEEESLLEREYCGHSVGDRENFLEAGMSDYVSKPIDQRKLVTAVARYAGFTMPDVDLTENAPQLTVDKSAQPLNDEAVEELNKLMGDLDNLLDGTDG